LIYSKLIIIERVPSSPNQLRLIINFIVYAGWNFGV